MHALSLSQAEAYLHHLDVPTPTQPDLASLNSLMAAHLRRVTFENIDVLLDRPIHLDGDAVWGKVVQRRRGGYCFELNNLFARLLLALGYRVDLLAGRVRWGLAPEAPQTMLSHLMLRVRLDQGPYLVDVGFGSAAPWLALPLESPIPPNIPYRLRPQSDGTDELQLEHYRADTGWLALHRFTLANAAWIDCTPHNWYTSTHPDSVFRQMLMIARNTDDYRLTLSNNTLNRRYWDGRLESRVIEDTDELIELLEKYFLLALTQSDIEPLRARLAGLLHPTS